MKNSSINTTPTDVKTEVFLNECSYKKECDFCNFNEWCRESEYLLLSNYGDIDAFKDQELFELISIEELFDNEFEPSIEGSAYEKYCRFESQYDLFDFNFVIWNNSHGMKELFYYL
tara:strand:- start:73 stop:420 length:348 start_codon:yes stop_codon:yes gene_type:complete